MENQNIQIYNYEGKEIRVIERADGSLWWVANELAEITGHKRIRDSVNKILDLDEVAIVGITDKSGKINHFQLINESGFYKLMFRSKLPKAKVFTKFVTSVILPEIRQTGSYSTKNALNARNSPRQTSSQRINRAKERTKQTVEILKNED